MSKRKRICAWCKFYVPEVCTRFPKWTDATERHYCGEHQWRTTAGQQIRKELKEAINAQFEQFS